MTAPNSASLSALDRVVHRKAKWIVERVRRRSSVPPPLEREFVSGESVLYLGCQYRLLVIEARELPPARLEQGKLVVGVPGHFGGSERAVLARASLVAWYKHRAQARFPERAEHWAAKLGLATPRILVRDQRLRWGSCDAAGTIRLNWRIVQAPSQLIDYVVVHELVHAIHRDHSRAFWAAMAKVMPDYERAKVGLLEWGPRLTW